MQREGSENPRFKATLPPLQPGNYRLRGEAELSERTIGSQNVDISVSEVSVEYQRVAQDRPNLLRIAVQSGGAYATVDGVEQMAARIPLEPRITRSVAELSLRTSVWIFTSILVLLALEWIIRKRVGMV
ncbi:MAG: hypothetical protein OEN01_12320 [Candidatus Krumholzibacteria bacterium]|nr:hypothetical protein [Candidatus Krumholzibacteria bacterium]